MSADCDMEPNRLLDMLACVECGSTSVRMNGDAYACADCDGAWPLRDGVYDLRPRQSIRLPKMYDDPDYREWNRRLAQIQDYFYEGRGLINWVQNAGHRIVRRWSRSRKGAHSRGLTLDLGCGHGAHRPYLEEADDVIGLDIDQDSLMRLRERYGDYFAVRGDCYRLPFRDACFDRIISIYNLEHLVHLDFALEEAARVLKDDGEFLVSVPAEGGWAWRTGRTLTSARHFTDETLDYVRANAIDHCNSIWQIEKAARRHFKIARSHYFPLFVPSYHFNLVVTWRLVK